MNSEKTSEPNPFLFNPEKVRSQRISEFSKILRVRFAKRVREYDELFYRKKFYLPHGAVTSKCQVHLRNEADNEQVLVALIDNSI